MARTDQITDTKTAASEDGLTFHADGHERIDLPATGFVADSTMTREGDDLILQTPDGQTAVIEGYFSADPAPVLHAPDGSVLTPNLVEAFAHSPLQYAANETATDQSPVGAAEEVKGHATVTRADGTVETITNGTPIYQGDVVETDAEGAVNIVFIDETSMAISANARLAIDEYTYDPETESGTTNFSVLRGLFVFTSGLIGRDDPDDVKIDTPVGSIGIRGTIIAGEIHPGGESNISVLEGAIVITNGAGEITLSEQFETVRLLGFEHPMRDMGTLPASDIAARFNSIGDVNPSLFTMINDAAQEQGNTPTPEAPKIETAPEPTSANDPQAPAQDISTGTQTDLPPPPPPLAPNVFETVDGSVAKLDTTGSTGLPTTGTITGDATSGLVDTTTAIGPLPPPPTGSALPPPPTTTDETLPPPPPPPLQPPPNVINGGNTGQTAPLNFINLDNTTAPGVVRITDNIGNKVGYSIAALGDINNDGLDDFVFTNNVSGQNHVYIVHGNSSGIPSGQIVDLAGTHITVKTTPTSSADSSATVIAGVGDFNGDNTLDYVVGQSLNDSITNGSGTAAIISGNSGDNKSFTTGLVGGDSVGTSVSGIGDFNNDGYADVIIGGPNGASGNGAAYYVGGSASLSGSINSATSLTGTAAGSSYGASVEGIGDFNGDGYSDFAVGAPDAMVSVHSNAGKVYLYYGSSAGAPVSPSVIINGPMVSGAGLGKEIINLGDINSDGKTDMLIAGNGNNGGIWLGGDTTVDIEFNIPSGANGYTVTGGGKAGDFNGDGFDDFALSIGDNTKTDTYIVFGRGTGQLPGTIDLTYLNDPSKAFKLGYSGATRADDMEVTSVGDVNGDGYDDLALGVPDLNGAATGDGGVMVVYGRSAAQSPNSVVGSSGNNFLTDNNTVNMSLRGGAGNDTLEINTMGFRSIDGGSGTDTILAKGNLDFSAVDFERMTSIEAIEFGANNQTIKLTLENLFNLLKTSDNGELRIGKSAGASGISHFILDDGIGGDGAAGATNSSTEIDSYLDARAGSVSIPGTETVSGTTYNTFTIGGYKLMIDQSITVDAQ